MRDGYEDIPTCSDCGRRLDPIRYGPGAIQCWACRGAGAPPVTEQPGDAPAHRKE